MGGGGGSSKSTTDKLKEKKFIVIIQEINSDGCTLIGNVIKTDSDIKDSIVESTSSSTTCTTYGRIAVDIKDDDSQGDCAEQTLLEFLEEEGEEIPQDISLLEDKTKSCVVGFDI